MFLTVLMAVYTYGGELKPNVDQSVEQLCSRIEKIYTAERLNDLNFDVRKDIDCRQLKLDIAFSKEMNRRKVLEEAIISKIELIKMPTDTNTLVSAEWIKDRGTWVWGFQFLSTPYKGDEENFWRLCRLAATIKPIDCPTYLAVRTRFVQTPENLKRREHQKRFYEINLWISEYKGAIVRHCARYITRVSETMPVKEFIIFSNQVEKVVQPDKISRGVLFYESEFKRRLRREELERRRNR